MKLFRLFFFITVALLAPQQAWANAGTPLLWTELLHLSLGNALIGCLEGSLLARMFGTSRPKAIGAMIVANYVSAWLGGVLIGTSVLKVAPVDLTNGWLWFWIMVGATFCLTLLLEWPFVAWSIRGTQQWLRRSIRGTLVVQSASYAILFTWYWLVCGTSLYTGANVVAPEHLSLPEFVLVYYISPSDGDVYRRPLTGGAEQKIYELHSTHHNDRLFVRPSTSTPDRWDLVARLDTGDSRNPKLVEVQKDMAVEAAPDPRSTRSDSPRYDGTWFNFGEASQFGSVTDKTWKFGTGFWSISGLVAENQRTGERVRLSFDTPFIAWNARNAVHLPSDKVLFQLGHDQICAFDPASRRVALLWRGRGPAPVIEVPLQAERTSD